MHYFNVDRKRKFLIGYSLIKYSENPYRKKGREKILRRGTAIPVMYLTKERAASTIILHYSSIIYISPYALYLIWDNAYSFD